MEKPKDSDIRLMSRTEEGAKVAAIWKWEWIVQATKMEVTVLAETGIFLWPECGLCLYYSDGEDCHDCPLESCMAEYDSYWFVTQAAGQLKAGTFTLAEFRVSAQKMLDKIKSL